VLLDWSDVTEEIDEMLEREERQEMERLLYVALTRAQHTLVLAFDEALFAKSGGEIHKHSQSMWLKANKEVNEVAFSKVGREPGSCDDTTEYFRRRLSGRGRDGIEIQLPDPKIDKRRAIRNASIFVRQLNPSGLPAEESTEIEEQRYALSQTPRSTSPALRYGLWWHDFAQRLLWKGDAKAWADVFEEYRQTSPDPARSLREWKLLLAHVATPENFRSGVGKDAIAHSEMPFLWRVDKSRCLEGVIDLAFFARSGAARAGKCLILDWKTDRVPPDNTETLQARYRPQVAAYWKAVSEIAKRIVEAAIYSTAAGALVRYTTEELAKEWSRLEKLSSDQFDVEVATEFRLNPSETTAPAATNTKPVQLELL
jgi:ATP-dependent exoDNAse (exonuclease V) beta subunit